MRVVEPSTKVVRVRPEQALAARVRAAAEAAVQALHEAADDRRLIQQREWGQSDRDPVGATG
jgi:hypothetical protein